MSREVDQRAWFRDIADASAAGLGMHPPEWLSRLHARGRSALARHRPLSRKQEAWRYSAIEGLFAQRFQAPEARVARPSDPPSPSVPEWESHRLLFVDGRLVVEASTLEGLPGGVTFGSLRDALIREPECLGEWLRPSAEHTDDPFTALNTALISDGLFLRVGAGVILDRPLEVIHWVSAAEEGVMRQRRHLVVVEEGAGVTLVERFIAAGPSRHFHNHLSEISLARGARLRHLRVREESGNAHLMESLFIAQGADSRYHATTLELGGGWLRSACNVDFQRPGGECRIDALSSVGSGELTDLHLDVRHHAPRCLSRQRVRGLLHGRGRTVVDGRVLVAKEAQGSDGRLSADHLLLDRDAEVDVKPQLEIYADDVKCGHGTTVGRLDPEQLFYLRARGIDARSARRMLCLGFARAITGEIELEVLREDLERRLAARIERAVGDDLAG